LSKKILITGANGFVGQALCRTLKDFSEYRLSLAVRDIHNPSLRDLNGAEIVGIADIGPETDWRKALEGVETVVHLAARVHIMNETASDPLAEFKQTNTKGTLRLARQASEAGVNRFIFISTIKVNGEEGQRPYTEDDTPNPQDPYAVSKFEAEEGLKRIASASAMEAVIVRPPLIYGPGVGGNFIKLIRLIDQGFPLPFLSINNRRSLLSVNNLAHFLIHCIGYSKKIKGTFLLSDGNDLSTPDLIRLLAQCLGKKARLFPVPKGLMKGISSALGQRAAFDRLWGSLQVDICKARKTLDWTPKYTHQHEMQQTTDWYHQKI